MGHKGCLVEHFLQTLDFTFSKLFVQPPGLAFWLPNLTEGHTSDDSAHIFILFNSSVKTLKSSRVKHAHCEQTQQVSPG